MRLLYLSYWGVSNGLTQATVLPHLEVLLGSTQIEKLIFASIERDPVGHFSPGFDASRILHFPIQARSTWPGLCARALDFMEMPATLGRLCHQHQVTRILARSSPAGSLAHLTQKHAKVPYIVESFEPHGTYMLESGVWSRWDPRYIFEQRWEEAQRREALALLPVAESYSELLRAAGVEKERVVTLPCTVDVDQFRFSQLSRARTRRALGIKPEEVVGIYVGQFGDIYYDREAFDVFGHFARAFARYRMIVLTPTPTPRVEALARAARFPRERLSLLRVPHSEVPDYLSAADLAFATIRMAPSRRYCSPVKMGEYWASGLPVVITEGVGDDSEVTRVERAGAVIDLSPASVAAGVELVRKLLSEAGHRARIATLGAELRGRQRVRSAYAQLGLL